MRAHDAPPKQRASAPLVVDVPLTTITIGERFRKDLGDIATLAASIEQHGLLHPIVLTTGYELVAGRRRLAAYAHLQRETIPAHVIDLDDPLGAELDENMQRCDLAPSEKVAVCAALEAREKHRARVRQKRGTKPEPSVTITEGSDGNTRDILARKVEWSWLTYERARAVVQAAREDEELQYLVDQMDKTGNVTRAYTQLPIYVRAPDEDGDATPAPRRPLRYPTILKRVDGVLQNTMVPNLRHLQDEDRAYLRQLLTFYITMIEKEEEAAHAGREC